MPATMIDQLTSDIERPETMGMPSGDRSQREFSDGSLRNTTNQIGTNNYHFQLNPHLAAISSDFPYPG